MSCSTHLDLSHMDMKTTAEDVQRLVVSSANLLLVWCQKIERLLPLLQKLNFSLSEVQKRLDCAPIKIRGEIAELQTQFTDAWLCHFRRCDVV
jgi:hypothetical protein